MSETEPRSNMTDKEKRQLDMEKEKRNKALGLWKPKKITAAKNQMHWCLKQAAQRQKTLELDGATHSKAYKDRLREEKRIYEEEAKRLKDFIDDGGR